MIEILHCEQNSPEWYQARLGIPTASEFSTVLAKGEGKTRRTYMLKLAGEIITGEPMDSYSNAHMERGKAMEDEARRLYAFANDAECERVGFIRNGQMGCSPDSLIGTSRGLEIKTALPHILIPLLLKGEFPPEHKAQVQGSMLVSEREEWDLVVYWPKMPLFVVRAMPDKDYLVNLKSELARFNDELAALVEQVKAFGGVS